MNMSLNDMIRKTVVPYRRGIMGTLIFHLLLAIFLLGMKISRLGVHTETEILVEAPETKEIRERQEAEQHKEDVRRRSSAEEVERMLRSIAVNENVKRHSENRETDVREYVGEILDELHEKGEGGRYKAKRDENFSRDSLQHLRDRSGRELDSLKSVFYSGESSVSYNLKDRFARFLPIPVFKCESGGKVVVEIAVTSRGTVQKAVVVESAFRSDESLWRVAVDAAERSRFNENPNAPALQKGTITYHFVRQ